MMYFIITEQLAKKLMLDEIRQGDSMGYVVNSTDIAIYGVDKAVDEGDAVFVTTKAATDFLKAVEERKSAPAEEPSADTTESTPADSAPADAATSTTE